MLSFNKIGKTFPGVRALDDVSFVVDEGSVHALLGENGAGKSTLLKILSGVYTASQGSLLIDGKSRAFRSTQEAIDAGISVIYQELQLVPEMSVAENLYLGHLPTSGGMIKRRELVENSRKLLAMLGEDINPRQKLGSLSIGQRQMVEIAKALGRNAKIIAFDEPTSSLSAREIDHLFGVIRDLKAQGKVILYVTHRLEEVFHICDTATVLRDGKHIQTFPLDDSVTRDRLVSLMVGRAIEDIYGYEPRPIGDPVLNVDRIMGPGLVVPTSFEVKKGEIVGFFGLVGAGRSELMKLTYGAVRRRCGSVVVGDRTLRHGGIRASIRAGLMFCSEDRKKEGVIPVRSVMENINISGRRHFLKYGLFIDNAKERQNAQTYIERLVIRTPSIHQLIMNLSGGNQQKVLLARWLCENMRAIILDEPTRGIDVGAKREIYDIIYELAQAGMGVVVVSSDLPEVLGICDRIVVMSEGRITAIIPRSEATQEGVMHFALPQSSKAAG
jgi:L-arabinose transport system ATP-binding protein